MRKDEEMKEDMLETILTWRSYWEEFKEKFLVFLCQTWEPLLSTLWMRKNLVEEYLQDILLMSKLFQWYSMPLKNV